MVAKLKYYWWYMFYVVYWTVEEQRKLKASQGNVSGFMTIVLSVNLTAFMHFLLSCGIPIKHWIYVVICFSIGSWISFIRNDAYLEKIEEFKFVKFLSEKQRIVILVLISLETIIFNSGIALLRNVYQTL